MSQPYADSSGIEVLVLAAGHARRFGADKRCARVDGERSLLEVTLARLGTAQLPVTVCLSSRTSDDALADLLVQRHVRVLRCERAEEGMGSTLAEAVAARAGSSAWLVALGDMPCVALGTIRELLRRRRPGAIVLPVDADGRRGHPVLFDRDFFAELCRLSGERGGASLLERHAAHCIEVPVDDPGIHLDADTPAALEALRAQLASRSSSGVSG